MDPQPDCDKTLAASQAAIDALSSATASNFDDLLNALKPTLAGADSRTYWTGDAHFWDDSTNDCDSFTQTRRTTMNGLVDAVNQNIQDAIDRFGSQAVCFPWAADVVIITGHYCEPGVDGWNALNREQTAFHE
ncbi:MAG: hypothetical protein Q9161_001006 [Pseudevernia consocians]